MKILTHITCHHDLPILPGILYGPAGFRARVVRPIWDIGDMAHSGYLAIQAVQNRWACLPAFPNAMPFSAIGPNCLFSSQYTHTQ